MNKFVLKTLLVVALYIVFIIVGNKCFAETKCGTVNSDVYVRSTEDGSIVGSFYKNDKIQVVGMKDGWYIISYNDKEYKVYSEYVDVSEEECESYSNMHKSKSAEKESKKTDSCLRDKKECSISGSVWENINPF